MLFTSFSADEFQLTWKSAYIPKYIPNASICMNADVQLLETFKTFSEKKKNQQDLYKSVHYVHYS